MGTLCFYPWLEIEEPLEIGDFKLLRYRTDRAQQGELTDIEEVDAILEPFVETHGDPIRQATLLQHSSQDHVTADLDEEYRSDVFAFSNLLAFTGLASRQFFTSLWYSNRDSYRVIVQQFSEARGGVAVTTRRRDGSTTTLSVRGVYRVTQPAHVMHHRLAIDEQLLRCLITARNQEGIYQALVLFNEANTDRSEMSDDTEIILTYAAIEQALELPGRPTGEVVAAFTEMTDATDEVPREDWRAPDGNQRADRLLENSPNLRQAWLQDFANLRGSLAHGHAGDDYPSCWTAKEHLLFAAHIVPLLIRIKSESRVGYDLSTSDTAGIAAFERLLNERHFRELSDQERQHPWGKILSNYRMRAFIDAAGDRFFGET